MASLIQELIQTLQSEDDLYKELIPIATKKTEIIIENDLASLQEITKQEQLTIEKINALEHKREEVIINIGTVLNRKPEALNMQTLVSLLEKQPKEQKELALVHDSLKQTISTMMMVNNRNKSLIHQSLEMIEFNMNLIQSTRMSPGSSMYTKGAEQTDLPGGIPGIFDAKQ